jgi:hypothetical protein
MLDATGCVELDDLVGPSLELSEDTGAEVSTPFNC